MKKIQIALNLYLIILIRTLEYEKIYKLNELKMVNNWPTEKITLTSICSTNNTMTHHNVIRCMPFTEGRYLIVEVSLTVMSIYVRVCMCICMIMYACVYMYIYINV